MPKIFLSIGSNVEREKNIPSALAALGKQFAPLTCSSLYESEAVGFEGAPFYNLVVSFDSGLSLEEISRRLRAIETDHGRSRSSAKFTPRTLDIDLILYGDMVIKTDSIELPRPDITRYAFVLAPLAEIEPELCHPVSGQSYRQLWEQFDKAGLQQRIVTPPWQDG